MTISEAAIRRGPSGFIRPPQTWEIIATLKTGASDTLKTTNKREARRRYDMIVKYSHDSCGKYSGASVRLTCDGELIAEYRAIQ